VHAVINGHDIAIETPITVLLDKTAPRAAVEAAEELVTTLYGKDASLHYLNGGVVAITPAPSGPRQAQRRYAHGGGVINRPRGGLPVRVHIAAGQSRCWLTLPSLILVGERRWMR
jgi:hypothetical protein